MDFTREPIIETIITPKEGFKLVIRNSSGKLQEEYGVSSVEIVSFGKSLFFRSLEKPKPFLLPVSEYEVIETREIRTVLKKPQTEKTIKIGGGKATGKTANKSKEKETHKENSEKEKPKKSSRRNSSSEKKPKKEAPPPSSTRRTLLPPPTSLISEQINRYKDYLSHKISGISQEDSEKEKVEKLELPQSEEPSLFPEETISQPSKMFEESEDIEDKIIEIEEEASASSETEEDWNP